MSNEDHESFVSTKEGCLQSEIFLIIIMGAVSIFVRNTTMPWINFGRRMDKSIFGFWMKFVVDFMIIVAPMALSLTIFSDHLSTIVRSFVATLGLTLILTTIEAMHIGPVVNLKNVLNRIIDEQHHPTKFFTYIRSIMFILINFAILAVDLPIFPRKFAKTVDYGYSLMDLGVAAVAYTMGMASSLKTLNEKEKRETESKKRAVKRRTAWLSHPAAVLFVIGAARTSVLAALQYPQHVSEYGQHWNFFFTIGVMKIVDRILPRSYPLLLTLIFGIAHQIVLMSGYEEWILVEGANDRSTFFAANAEGIVSLPGYLTLFYGAMTIGKFIANTGIRIKSWLHRTMHLFIYAMIFLALEHFVAQPLVGKPSRRVVNLTFILGQLSILTFGCAIAMSTQMCTIFLWAAGVPHFSNGDDPFHVTEPCLAVSINSHTLVTFMIANVLTGLTNMSIDTHNAKDEHAVIILTVYSLIVSLVPHYLSQRKSKLFGERKKE